MAVLLLTTTLIFILSSIAYADDAKQRSTTGIQHCPGGIVINKPESGSKFGINNDRPRTMKYGMGKLIQGRDKRFYCEYSVVPNFACENIDKACTAKEVDSNNYVCICPQLLDLSTVHINKG